MGTDSEQISQAVLVPDRPTTAQIIETVAKTFGLEKEGVFNRKLHKEAFQSMVYLLSRGGERATQGGGRHGWNIVHPGLSNTEMFKNVDEHRPLSAPIQALLRMYEVESRPAPPSVAG